jgi:hypothetical protein
MVECTARPAREGVLYCVPGLGGDTQWVSESI